MENNTTIESEEKLSISQFAEKAYLDYSMYVILDRALPHIADGLKPVQRRIIYAMSELGLKTTAKFKKSARTVGDVLGKFHPHGDTACYEAMVIMAQHFSYRYPLVDGQGNWGSADDPKSFAAMRYTESKLSAFADLLLSEINLGTVKWTPNFDGTLDEPLLLPSRVPHIILNGTTGIAVGMATDIPPHNLREVVNACIHLLDNPKATIKDLMVYIKAPDYPTEAEIITPVSEIADMYGSGHGSIRMRAIYMREDNDIIITALPHQVSGAKVLEQIATQMNAKKLPMVVDLRDESDHENPTRLVIVPRSNRIDYDVLMAHLFATTDLERSYRVNLNMIGTDGRPQVKSITGILSEWLMHRIDVVKQRLQYRLDKVNTRLHLLDGLLIAFLNIDEVIAIIRNEDKPKPVLMARFQLSDVQAEGILELKLRHLAKLEEIKIRAEQEALDKERANIEKTLGSSARLKTLVRKELQEDAENFGDDRRSPVVEREEAQAMSETEVLPSETVTVVLSEKGWVRAAKGHDVDCEALNYRAGDKFLASALGRSNQLAVFFDSTGRGYTMASHTLPSARSQGEPLTSRLNPPAGAQFLSVLMGEASSLYLLASDAGYGFVAKLEDLMTKNRNGKAVLSVPKGSQALSACAVSDYEHDMVAAVTNEGRLLIFPLIELPKLSKGKGNKIIAVPAASVVSREEYMVGLTVMQKKSTLTLRAGQRKLVLKYSEWSHYIGERGRRGNKLPRGFQRVEQIFIAENE